MPISDNIKKLRQIFDVTQDELGEIAGVTGNAVSQWEMAAPNPVWELLSAWRPAIRLVSHTL